MTAAQTLRQIKQAYHAREDRAAQPPDMLKAALWYAKHGYYVFPLHTPIFDGAGNCTGCTCEKWKRTQRQYGPDFKCDQPGKCPRVKWHDKSTIDLEQIRQWWKWWPDANIGIDAGKSDLLVPDADSYKDNYAGDALQLDEQTIKSLTGGGGSHLWYRQPAGKSYGNATGDLPKGIDIRGHGGYIVAPPSLHWAGRRYAFAKGHSPADLDPLPLPQFLTDILEAAQVASQARPVNFTTNSADAPNLACWWLPDDVLELIHNGAPKGDRSEADYRVILALARAGATDDDMRAVFTHFAIGAKYDERGDKYLAHSIGKARAWLVDHPPDEGTMGPAVAERLAVARGWVRSPDCIDRLRPFTKRIADLVIELDGLLEMAQMKRTTRIVTTMNDIGDHCGLYSSTAHRRLARLEDAGLLTTKLDPYGTLIDLSPLLDLSGTVSTNVQSVPLRSTSEEDFFADHRCDDAFTSYPYSYAIKRREVPTVLMQSLGSSGLILWDALIEGGTVKELAELTGLTVPAVRVTLKRYDSLGLLVIWQEGRAKVYELHPNAEERLEERREHMVTAGIGQIRAARNANARASYAERKLQGRMPLEPRQKAMLEKRRDQADAKAAAHYESLTQMGINPHAKVMHRPPRPKRRFDAGEEWHSWGRDLWEVWQLLGDDSREDKIRLLTISEVGEESDGEIYRKVRRHISEQVDLMLSLAPRRAHLEQPYWHPDLVEDAIATSASLPPINPVLFEVAA